MRKIPERFWPRAAGALVAAVLAGQPVAALPVFPGAVGFGTDTPAGRGGAVYRVTNLDDDGPGSLRHGIEDTPGPRTIIFDVAGTIRLKSDLVVRPDRGFLTIAGQTAPFPGITLANAGLAVQGHNVLVQHIAVRPGDRLKPVDNRDAVKLEPGPDAPVHHVVIDHVSASWAVDETISTWGGRQPVHDVTISNCLIYEPIINGGHSKGSHPYGVLGGRNTRNLTVRANVMAFCWGRNPLIRDEINGAQIVNNFIYRPGIWSNGAIYLGDLTLPPHAVTVAGNIVMRHPVPFALEMTDEKGQRTRRTFADSDDRNTGIYVYKTVSPHAGLYLHDNRFFDPRTGEWHPRDGDPWNSEVFRDSPEQPVARLTQDPFANSGGVAWQPWPAVEVESRTLADAGKMPARRDALDSALMGKIAARTGSFREDLAAPGEDPWAQVDIPSRRRLELPHNPAGDADADGYTNLEEWLHGLAAAVEMDGGTWTARLVAHESFQNESWRERWVVEGNASAIAERGRLAVVTASGPGIEPAVTQWWREPLPADVMIELIASTDFPAEDNAGNLNLIVHAREQDGRPYGFGRTGRYPEYQQVPNYIFTLTGGFQEGWARVRRNPGFELLAEAPGERSEIGAVHRLRVAIAGGRLRYWIDGRLVHDVRDPRPLTGGQFGLRTWRSRVGWADVRIYALERVAVERVR
ncbi:MAG TPA: DUF6250 domain-containing protein [Opitutaceae bacterium]